MPKKQIVIESDELKNELEVKYYDGDELKTTALIVLVDHAPNMSFITHGKAEKIARLIFGAYRIAVEKASSGSPQDAFFVDMLEKVCEDIAKVASFRKNRIDPEELIEKLEGLDPTRADRKNRKHH